MFYEKNFIVYMIYITTMVIITALYLIMASCSSESEILSETVSENYSVVEQTIQPEQIISVYDADGNIVGQYTGEYSVQID